MQPALKSNGVLAAASLLSLMLVPVEAAAQVYPSCPVQDEKAHYETALGNLSLSPEVPAGAAVASSDFTPLQALSSSDVLKKWLAPNLGVIALRRLNQNNQSCVSFCNGVLLDRTTILTAGHCLKESEGSSVHKNDWRAVGAFVRLGYLDREKDVGNVVELDVVGARRFPNADLATIPLKSPFMGSAKGIPIALPGDAPSNYFLIGSRMGEPLERSRPCILPGNFEAAGLTFAYGCGKTIGSQSGSALIGLMPDQRVVLVGIHSETRELNTGMPSGRAVSVVQARAQYRTYFDDISESAEPLKIDGLGGAVLKTGVLSMREVSNLLLVDNPVAVAEDNNTQANAVGGQIEIRFSAPVLKKEQQFDFVVSATDGLLKQYIGQARLEGRDPVRTRLVCDTLFQRWYQAALLDWDKNKFEVRRYLVPGIEPESQRNGSAAEKAFQVLERSGNVLRARQYVVFQFHGDSQSGSLCTITIASHSPHSPTR